MKENIQTAVENRRLQLERLQREQERQKNFFGNLWYGMLLALIATVGSCGMLYVHVEGIEEKQEGFTQIVTEQGREINQLKQKNERIESIVQSLLVKDVVGEIR